MKFKALTSLIVASAACAGLSSQVLAQNDRDLLTLISTKPQFSTLAKAVDAAGLKDALRDAGGAEYTLFAPTNEAFAKLPAADLEELLKPENKDKLAEILKYHLVAGKGRTIAELPRKRELQSVQGSDIKVELAQGRVRVDGARVGRDFSTSNGIVVSVDSVMLPN